MPLVKTLFTLSAPSPSLPHSSDNADDDDVDDDADQRQMAGFNAALTAVCRQLAALTDAGLVMFGELIDEVDKVQATTTRLTARLTKLTGNVELVTLADDELDSCNSWISSGHHSGLYCCTVCD